MKRPLSERIRDWWRGNSEPAAFWATALFILPICFAGFVCGFVGKAFRHGFDRGGESLTALMAFAVKSR